MESQRGGEWGAERGETSGHPFCYYFIGSVISTRLLLDIYLRSKPYITLFVSAGAVGLCKWRVIHHWTNPIDRFCGTDVPSPRTTKHSQGTSWDLATNKVWVLCPSVIYCMLYGLSCYAIKEFMWNNTKYFYKEFSKGPQDRGQKRSCNDSLYPQPWTLSTYTTLPGFQVLRQKENYSCKRKITLSFVLTVKNLWRCNVKSI